MMSLMKVARKRRTGREFKPTWNGRESGGRLEGRAMAAPAFFMLSPGNPLRRYDVAAWIGGDAQLLPLSINTATNAATNGGQGTQYQFGQPNIVIQGQVSSAWVDVDNAGGPGTAPVGSFVVSGSTTSQLSGEHVGFVPGIPARLSTRATSGRTYVLADTANPSVSPITLIETYYVTYAASPGPTFTSQLVATVTSPTFGNFTVFGDQTGVWGTSINGGIPVAVGTTVIGTGATLSGALPSSFTFGSSAMGASLTVTTVFPSGVPSTAASSPPNTNPVAGVGFTVANNVLHTLTDTGNGPPGLNPHGQTGLTTATSSYEARFYA